jgi:hypothetical protein
MRFDGGDCARLGRALAAGDHREYDKVKGSLTPAMKAEIARWRDGTECQQRDKSSRNTRTSAGESETVGDFATRRKKESPPPADLVASGDLDYWADDRDRLPEDDGSVGVEERQGVCKACGGRGRDSAGRVCGTCHGIGRVSVADDDDDDDEEKKKHEDDNEDDDY